ncbi:MAG: RNA polymerase sigma factor [Verrucomicrobia bacterium]|nr:RNA polymerase sigma factor [Verrucomicrobiota bacterium]
MTSDDTAAARPPQAWFVTTHWTVVLAAARSDSTRAQVSLAKLCQTYWYPLYAFVRRRGCSPPDAEDLTQEFFARLLEKQALAGISREKGRFRSFLLTALKHFLVDEWKKARREKRGGGQVISLDAQEAESRYALEPVDARTPETIFEQNWALALLDTVFDALRREHEAAGKAGLFAELKFCLTGRRSAVPYTELAARLKMPENTVKTLVHRLRQRYRELLRQEVANTVAHPNEVEEEMRALFRALAA